jgi:hypothetical protein
MPEETCDICGSRYAPGHLRRICVGGEWIGECDMCRVRRYPLDMAQIICPDCRRDAYPDSLGEALDWALGHKCDAETTDA